MRPGFDTREVPIGSVTNGVHTPTWVASEVAALAAGRLGNGRRQPPRLLKPPATRQLLRSRLVAETRRLLRASWQQRGASGAELTWIDDVLDKANTSTAIWSRKARTHPRWSPGT